MYNQITSNKRKTLLLMGGVGSLLVAIAATAGYLWGMDVRSAVGLALGFSLIYTLGSYFFADRVALGVSGAVRITKAQAPEIWNLVENLCIASGQPMPALYLINDPHPNAFATGRDPQHASVAFTTGLLAQLSKRELEGVAAHELSHIKNYDIRVMTIVVVLVGAIVLIADILLHSGLRGRNRESNNGILLIVGLAVAILAPIAGELIKLAISRNREYLADASGALLTRYPDGLASALEKIASATTTPLARANGATAHLYISDPYGAVQTRRRLTHLFATHPPIADRIARLRGMTL